MINMHTNWFLDNELYLPDEVSKGWKSININLLKIKQLAKRDTRDSNKMEELENSVHKTFGEVKKILSKKFTR